MHRVDHAFDPVIEDVRDVADGVAVGEQIPATGTVTVVVEPGSENEIGRRAEEDAGCRRNKTLVVTIFDGDKGEEKVTHMMISQVMNPQWLEELLPLLSRTWLSHAYLVFQSSFRT